MNQHYTYLLLNFFTLLFPLLLSFDKKVRFYKKWKFIFPGLFFTGLLYLVWDYIFTLFQVWSFNPNYILSIKLYGLPLEEILFFVTVPFSCIFIYECLLAYLKIDYLQKIAPFINYFLLALSLIMIIVYSDRLYSTINFATLLALMFYVQFLNNKVEMGRFYLAYFITLIPFYIINGVLTSLPVVTYNPTENMGFRVGTIPFEDHFYSLSLFLINVLFFEYYRKKSRVIY
jgi:lycopene cyclase domain-containing protein